MDSQAYDNMAAIEDRMWWYRGRRTICTGVLERLLPPSTDRRILDVGCGTGRNMELLQRFGRTEGIDFAPEAIEYCRARGVDGVAQADATQLPFPSHSFDLVSALDVVEHIEDDRAALREMGRVLVPGGHLLIYTPALPWLYGEHDRIVRHQRRYLKSQLKERIRGEGFSVRHLAYANLFVLPLVLLARGVLALMPRRPHAEMSVPPEPFNQVLTWICRAEVPLVMAGALPVGMSLLALCQKPASGVASPTTR